MVPAITICKLFGFDFVSNPLDQTCSILSGGPIGNKNIVITPNAEQIVKYKKMTKDDSPFVKSVLERAIVLPDGQPIVGVSKLFKGAITERLAGSDIFPKLIKMLDLQKKRVYLVGPNDLALKQLLDKMSNKNNFKVYAPPYFCLDERKNVVERVFNDINKFEADFVFVFLGFPKQEVISMDVIKKLNEAGQGLPLFFCFGASLEFFVGTKKRAPVWLQKIGCEWLYRLFKEPKRLWSRYATSIFAFLGIILQEIFDRCRYKKSTG